MFLNWRILSQPWCPQLKLVGLSQESMIYYMGKHLENQQLAIQTAVITVFICCCLSPMQGLCVWCFSLSSCLSFP